MKVCLQTIPKRLEVSQRIRTQLIDLGVNPKDIKLFVDSELRGPFWNFKQILAANQGCKEPVVYFQDDIILGDRFLNHLEDLLEKNLYCVSLFAPPRQQYAKALLNGFNAYEERKFLWMQGVIFSPDSIKELSEDVEEYSLRSSDLFVQRSFIKRKRLVTICLPSLIQHDLSIKSSLGTPAKLGRTVRESQVFEPIPEGHFKKLNYGK